MAAVVSPNQSDVFNVLVQFLTGFLPTGTKVIQGQINRVAEPRDSDFVVFWPLRTPRLATNIDTAEDVTFTASIAGTIMTVSAVATGTIKVGATVFGTGLASGTTVVTGMISGTGLTGTYSVGLSQIAAEQPMASGGAQQKQKAQWTIQLDVHGPNSADNAVMISTLTRDPYGWERINGLNPNMAPLYADDPRQAQFNNENQQVENRWVVEMNLQVDQTVTGIPQQFADALEVTVRSVEAEFPIS